MFTENEKFLMALLFGASLGMGWFIGKSNYYKRLSEQQDQALDIVVRGAAILRNELERMQERMQEKEA